MNPTQPLPWDFLNPAKSKPYTGGQGNLFNDVMNQGQPLTQNLNFGASTSSPTSAFDSGSFDAFQQSMQPQGTPSGTGVNFEASSLFNPQGQGNTSNMNQMFQPNQQDFSNFDGSFFGGYASKDPITGKTLLGADGRPIMETGMTGSDMLGSALGVGQLGLNWFMGDRQMDVAEGNLAVNQGVLADARASNKALQEKYSRGGPLKSGEVLT